MDQNPPTAGTRQAGQNADKRGFTGTVGTEQAEKFALLNVKADVVQRLEAGAGLVARSGIDFGDGLKGYGWHEPAILGVVAFCLWQGSVWPRKPS